MKVLRSWPAAVPSGRSYVVDGLQRLVLSDYDYAPLADVGDDVVLLEWDVAVDRGDLDAFIAAALADPGRVLVAPYRLYVTTVHHRPLKRPVWAHRRADGSHVDTGEPDCASFGFGLAYFPRAVVEAFRAEWPGHFSDGSLSGWHRRKVTDRVPICWDVRPVHLHYHSDDLGAGTVPPPAPVPVTDPAADERAARTVTDPYVAALLRERAGLARAGKVARVAAVNEQLAVRGYTD